MYARFKIRISFDGIKQEKSRSSWCFVLRNRNSYVLFCAREEDACVLCRVYSVRVLYIVFVYIFTHVLRVSVFSVLICVFSFHFSSPNSMFDISVKRYSSYFMTFNEKCLEEKKFMRKLNVIIESVIKRNN